MDHDYKKISTNWNKFLAEGAFNLKEEEEPNLVGQTISKPKSSKKEGDFIKKVMRKLPKPLRNKAFEAAARMGVRAIKDQNMSARELLDFLKGLGDLVTDKDPISKKKKFEDLQKTPEWDFTFGKLPVQTRGQAGGGTMAGGQFTMRFEEWLNADESVNILTEQDLRLDKAGYLKLLQDLIVEYGEEVIKKHGPGAFNSEKALEVYKSLVADYKDIIRKSSSGAVTDITLKWARDKEKQKVINAVHAIAKIPFR